MLDSGTLTSWCRFVKFKIGVVITSVQFVVVKSAFSCNTNGIEGTIHEMMKLLSEGMMLNTGTVIEEGSNLWLEGGKVAKSVAPFSWGAKAKYEEDRFVADLRKIMARRNIQMSESREKFIRAIMKGVK